MVYARQMGNGRAIAMAYAPRKGRAIAMRLSSFRQDAHQLVNLGRL